MREEMNAGPLVVTFKKDPNLDLTREHPPYVLRDCSALSQILNREPSNAFAIMGRATERLKRATSLKRQGRNWRVSGFEAQSPANADFLPQNNQQPKSSAR
jgi:hypothetical protein